MISAIVVAMTFVVSRLLVMHHEYFGTMKYGTIKYRNIQAISGDDTVFSA